MEGLLGPVRRALADEEPAHLLGFASAALAIMVHPASFEREKYERHRDRVVEELVLGYVDMHTHESIAFAAALTALVGDAALRRQLAGALDGADDDLPRWLVEVDQASLDRSVMVTEVFDDREWLLFGVRLTDDTSFSVRIEIDHSADGSVVDGSVLGASIDDVLDRIRSQSPAERVSVSDLQPAQAITRFCDAVEAAEGQAEPPRTATWPSCRPLVEWAVRRQDGELNER